MCAPAHHTGYGENRGIQFHGKAKHFVDKAGIEVHIDAYALVHLPFPCDDLGGETFHTVIKFKFVVQPFFFGKLFHETLKDHGTGIGFGINRVAYAINQACMVKSILMQETFQIAADFLIIVPVMDFGF